MALLDNPERMKRLVRMEYERGVVSASLGKRSFRHFFRAAWPVLEPTTTFIDGWHLDAVAEHLTAVSQGEIKRLLVNMPPRHCKSTLISVLWSVWLLINDPSTRLLCASYALNLATRDNIKARRLIKSPWFQQRYGDIFTLQTDQDAKMKFETDQLGYRMVTSVGAGTTGEGGRYLLLDDAHAIDEKESPQKRRAALDWFDNTWCTRLNDPQTSAMVVIGHRIHEEDVSGHILETDTAGEWVHLNLPAEYESASACRTYLPSGKEFWRDPRTKDGELLWPERFPQAIIENAKRRHGPLGYAALYGQRPTPATGGTFKISNERLCTQAQDNYVLHTPLGMKAVKKEECVLFMTVDPAISEAQSADYTVIMTCAKTPIKDTLILDVRRGHWDHNAQQDEIADAYKEHDVEFVAVETVAYQHALFQDLVTKGIPCRPFKPHSDKVARASTASIWQGNGKIYFLKGAAWLAEFQKELYKFPMAAHDDQVDALSLASIVVRSRGPLSDASDDEDEVPEAAEETGGPTPLTVPLKKKEATATVPRTTRPIDPFEWADQHMG
jgi:predicted phage terminase large subunit-like protein